MEDPRIRKFAQFLIRSAVGLEKGEKILIELHGSETGLMKALVQEAYAVGGKPFVHIFYYAVEGALVQGADAEHMEEIASYELERMRAEVDEEYAFEKLRQKAQAVTGMEVHYLYEQEALLAEMRAAKEGVSAHE